MPKPITPAQVALTIKVNNALWKRSTPAQRRVLIAEDVLARITSKQYTAEHYTYSEIDTSCPSTGSTQAAILAKQASCTCCARGALFFSHIVFRNKVALSELDWNHGPANDQNRAGLDDVFSQQQQELIEAAFEGWSFSRAQANDNHEGSEGTVAFHDRYDTAKARLRAICHNLVRNDGVFVLPKARARAVSA